MLDKIFRVADGLLGNGLSLLVHKWKLVLCVYVSVAVIGTCGVFMQMIDNSKYTY